EFLMPNSQFLIALHGGRHADILDGLVRLGKPERDEELDDGPRRIELAGAPAEFGTPRVAVMVVVEAFAAGQEGEQADVRRRVVEVLVADVMAQPVDRR